MRRALRRSTCLCSSAGARGRSELDDGDLTTIRSNPTGMRNSGIPAARINQQRDRSTNGDQSKYGQGFSPTGNGKDEGVDPFRNCGEDSRLTTRCRATVIKVTYELVRLRSLR